MRKTLKKSFAVLLVVFMLVGVVPFAALAATTTVSNEAGLRSAVAGAASGDIIDVTSNIQLTQALTVSGKVTIKSSNGSSLVRASSYANYMIVVANGGELTLEGITVNGNRTSAATADLAKEVIVVQAGGILNMNDGTTVTTNRANMATNGAGITVAGTFNMNGGLIANMHLHNSSSATTMYGAAITVSGGTVNMYGGQIGGDAIDSAYQNDGRNGAIGVVSGTFNMYGGQISGNVANQQGGGAGGVHIAAAGTFNMYDGAVKNNNSRVNGGGFLNQGTLNIIGGEISGNTATYTEKTTYTANYYFGAAVYNQGTLNISGGTISGNTAKFCGGAVYNYGTMTMTGGTITGNRSQSFSGGALFVDGSGTLNISGGEISGNTAGQFGGAIAATSSASNALVITSCIFGNNTCGASNCGSDIYITKANTSNVITSYDYECIHFQLYVDKTGARYSASNQVPMNSSVLTAGDGYVYVGSGEGHAWGEWVVISNPTCTETGSSQRTCQNCGKVETTTTAALGHSWNNGATQVAPTCTATGTTLFTCTRCGATKTEPVPALGHVQTNVQTTPATCTTAGSTSYTCSRCGKTFTESIPALGHVSVTTTVNPTCTTAGSTTVTCSRCGVVLSSTPIAALGHNPGDWEVVTPATKTSTGLKVKKCTRCGTTLESEVIPMIPDATIIAATVEIATTPKTLVEVPITFIGNEGIWSMGFYAAYDSQLTLKGVKQGDVFTTVSDSVTVIDPATDSDAAAALTAAGIATTGVKCYRFYAENYLLDNITEDGTLCTLVFNVPSTIDYELPIKLAPIAGMTINADAEDINLLKTDGAIVIPSNNTCAHTSFTWTQTKAPTCTEAGSRSKICNSCGRTLATEPIAALGHSYGAYTQTVAPTCTAPGQEASTCSRCGAASYREIAALGHTYSAYVTTTPATCTEEGVLTATCSRCHNQITDSIPALGHTAGEWVVETEAVGATDGLKVKRCIRCNIILEEEVIPAPYKPAIVASTEEAEGNTTVSATISFNNNPGVWSMVFYVYYDEALTLNSITNGSIYAASELTVSSNLRRDPSFKADCVAAFTECGVSTAGKKVAAVFFMPNADVDVTGEGVLLNLSFTTPDVLEGNYVYGIVNNADEIYNYAETNVIVNRTTGEIQVRESVCDHVWSAWSTVSAATCTEAGSESRTCSVCGKTETQPIAALGHNVPNPTTTEPTCTAAGFTGGVCTRCGQSIGETIPALGHNWGEWVQIDDTHMQRTCSRCGEVATIEFSPDPTITVIGANVKEGETFTIPVMLTGNPGVWSLLSYVYFDADLELLSVENGDVFAASELTTSDSLNKLPSESANASAAFAEHGIDATGCRLASLFFMCDAFADNTNNGTLAYLTFQAPEEEGTYLVGYTFLQDDTYNNNDDEVTFETVSGNVVVSQCNHVAGTVENVPATCTEAGYYRVYCSICGNVIEETTYPAKGHTPGDWEVVTAATATTAGLKVKKCTVCGITLEEKEIPPTSSGVITVGEVTAYANEAFTVPVTVSNNPGVYSIHVYLTYPDTVSVTKVTGSEDVLADMDVGKLNQDPNSSTTARKAFTYCNESMTGVNTTSISLYNEEDEDTNANGKLFDAKFAGLPVGTYRVYLVMRDDECFRYEDEENVPMILEDATIYVIERPTCEHTNTTTETVNATCTTAGYVKVTCSDCGAIVSNTVIQPLGHNYVETENVPATCTAAGHVTQTCSRCGDVQTTTTQALGHNYVETENVAATCTAAGHVTQTCSRCGDTKTTTTQALGHKYTAVVTPATCTTDGYTTYTCSRCGDSYTVDGPEALGHSWGAWVEVSATLRQRTCSRCGETESEIIADFTLGDVDGDGKVNAKDLKLLKQLMAGTALIEDVVFANTDINNDGKITSRDVALLKGYLLGTYLYEDLIAAHGN